MKDQGITRIECSRHHFDEAKNQWIVNFKRFNGGFESIMQNEVFADVVKKLNAIIPVNNTFLLLYVKRKALT
ncbi:MAG: hypothetical protein MJZ23_07290 [Paludibacteraceae bacterium]|nr:hypothetical protein [Paludibacteraceae bacterium]